MKKSFSLIIVLFFISNLFAQTGKRPNRLFKKNQADIYVSVGVLPTFLADNATQKILPLNIGADFMVGENFSIGGMAGYSIAETGMKEFAGGENGNIRNNYFEATLKLGLHVTKNDNMSIYGGFLLSYHRSDIKVMEGDLEKINSHTNIKTSQQKILPGGYVGYKYALSKKITGMAEVGYGVSIFRVGVGYRIK